MAQGPIKMSREMAEVLATRCDAITAGVVANVQDFASDPTIRREMYRVIGVQLIEGTYDVGANHKRLTETKCPE